MGPGWVRERACGSGAASNITVLVPHREFSKEPELMPKTPSQKNRRKKRRVSYVQDENRDPVRKRCEEGQLGRRGPWRVGAYREALVRRCSWGAEAGRGSGGYHVGRGVECPWEIKCDRRPLDRGVQSVCVCFLYLGGWEGFPEVGEKRKSKLLLGSKELEVCTRDPPVAVFDSVHGNDLGLQSTGGERLGLGVR